MKLIDLIEQLNELPRSWMDREVWFEGEHSITFSGKVFTNGTIVMLGDGEGVAQWGDGEWEDVTP